MEQNEWIKIEDGLPRNEKYVLVYAKGGRTLAALFRNQVFYCYDIASEELDDIEEVTHWQHLPRPPKDRL